MFDKLLPYERQENESDRAWAAFVVYRELGPDRSIAAACKVLKKNTTTVSEWCRQHGWVKRIYAWDIEQDRRRRLAELTAIEEMRKRQVRLAMKFQKISEIELNKILAYAEAHGGALALSPEAIARYADQGTKLERLTRGEPSEITQSTGDNDIDYGSLSVDEIQILKAVYIKLRKNKEDEKGKEKEDER